ncbi:MAG: segregation/condensation protein A [Acidobacteriota bacterium]|nr:segregation/condensation protein A [Acidobacteriota bacterium]
MTASLPFPQVLSTYEDPRDLLLDLIERQGGTLDRLPLAPVAAQYLSYVETAQERDLRLDAEWLYMASTLILWKSRSLLPTDSKLAIPGSDGLPAELVEQLRERERERAAAAALLLRDKLAAESGAFSHASISAFQEPTPPESEDENEPFFSLFDLIRLFEDLGHQAGALAEARHQLPLEVPSEEVTTEQMMVWFRSRLAAEHPGELLDATTLLQEQESAARRNTLFLAMLESARNQEVALHQAEAFKPILCRRVAMSR